MAFQTTESKREEYRKYLEKSGVIDQLTRVLVELYEENNKPENAIEYIKKYLGSPSDVDVDSLKLQHSKLRDDNIALKAKLSNKHTPLFVINNNHDSHSNAEPQIALWQSGES